MPGNKKQHKTKNLFLDLKFHQKNIFLETTTVTQGSSTKNNEQSQAIHHLKQSGARNKRGEHALVETQWVLEHLLCVDAFHKMPPVFSRLSNKLML